MSRGNTIGHFELIDHGIEHAQYFAGCGTSCTTFNNVVTGCGDNPHDAVDDLLEQLATTHDVDDVDDVLQRLLDDCGLSEFPTTPDVYDADDDADDAQRWQVRAVSFNGMTTHNETYDDADDARCVVSSMLRRRRSIGLDVTRHAVDDDTRTYETTSDGLVTDDCGLLTLSPVDDDADDDADDYNKNHYYVSLRWNDAQHLCKALPDDVRANYLDTVRIGDDLVLCLYSDCRTHDDGRTVTHFELFHRDTDDDTGLCRVLTGGIRNPSSCSVDGWQTVSAILSFASCEYDNDDNDAQTDWRGMFAEHVAIAKHEYDTLHDDTRTCYGLWYGGNNYGQPDVLNDDDIDTASSVACLGELLIDRLYNRASPDTPCVDASSCYIDVYLDEQPDGQRPCDFRLVVDTKRDTWTIDNG